MRSYRAECPLRKIQIARFGTTVAQRGIPHWLSKSSPSAVVCSVCRLQSLIIGRAPNPVCITLAWFGLGLAPVQVSPKILAHQALFWNTVVASWRAQKNTMPTDPLPLWPSPVTLAVCDVCGVFCSKVTRKASARELRKVIQGNTRNFKLTKLFYILDVLDKKKWDSHYQP
jgi:hypothetical protein